MNRIIKNFAVVSFAFFLYAARAYAGDASLFLFPEHGSYAVGEVFQVSVHIDTGGETINAVEGKILFNKDELEVLDVSEEETILLSWTLRPTFSNSDGVVNFGGTTGREGFQGDSGKLFSISFKALKGKASTVQFSMGAAALAVDGNILTSMKPGVYELSSDEVVPSLESITTVSNEEDPEADNASSSANIIIVSSNTPNQNVWYRATTTEFSWNVSDDATTARISFDRAPTSTPAVEYTPPISKKTIKNISDGVSYFHVQTQTPEGLSEVAHFQVRIDTTSPEHFSIKEHDSPTSFSFLFDAADSISGIEKYSVRVDDGEEAVWIDNGTHLFSPIGLIPGAHTLQAKAFDFAGNYATSSISFAVLEVDPPTLSSVAKECIFGEDFIISGEADPAAVVRIYIAKNGNVSTTEIADRSSDNRFSFNLGKKKLEVGTYEVWATAAVKGVESEPSAKSSITVRQSKLVILGTMAVSLLKNFLTYVLPVLLLLFSGVFGWRKIRGRNKKKGNELNESEEDTNESFSDAEGGVSPIQIDPFVVRISKK